VESGGTVSTAIWRAKHVRGPWERPAAPQIVGTKGTWDEDNTCVYGAAIAPDGATIGATYAGYSYFNRSHQTDALGIAFGRLANAFEATAWRKQPAPILTRGPEAWDKGAIHEHELVQLPPSRKHPAGLFV
jgi:hypothetical protein